MNRSSVFFAFLLIGLGVILLAFNFLGLNAGKTWPILFFILAVACYLPPFLWPSIRKFLAGLFIPGSILLVFGLVFFYNTLTGDWASWGYAWILLNAGVGLGLLLAAWFGGWGSDVREVGVWMLGVSLAVFSLFGVIFGGSALKIITSVLLVLSGILLLIRSLRR